MCTLALFLYVVKSPFVSGNLITKLTLPSLFTLTLLFIWVQINNWIGRFQIYFSNVRFEVRMSLLNCVCSEYVLFVLAHLWTGEFPLFLLFSIDYWRFNHDMIIQTFVVRSRFIFFINFLIYHFLIKWLLACHWTIKLLFL